MLDNLLIYRDLSQARGQVLEFEGEKTSLGDKVFVYIVCLKQILWAQQHLVEHKRNLGGNFPRLPTRLRTWAQHQ